MANLKKHDKNVLAQHYARLGRLGGKARAKALTPERRREIAAKANQAAATKRGGKPPASN